MKNIFYHDAAHGSGEHKSVFITEKGNFCYQYKLDTYYLVEACLFDLQLQYKTIKNLYFFICPSSTVIYQVRLYDSN